MSDLNFTAERILQILEPKQLPLEEKRMFGGRCFMVDEKMLIATIKGGVLARVNPDEVSEFLKKEGVEQMLQRERPMKGYLMLREEAYDGDKDLEFWVNKCLEWNPKVKKRKKKVK